MPPPSLNDPEQRRAEFLLDVVYRPLMFLFWALILWGTFYGFAWLYAAITSGPVTAARQAASGQDVLGGGINLLLAITAALVWSLAAFSCFQRRGRRAERSGHAAGHETTETSGPVDREGNDRA